MFWNKADDKEKNLKNLSEKDIQKQLYGGYLKKGDYRIEVMDSTAIGKENDDRPIEEKFNAKIKKEVDAELQDLRNEFKHLKNEVNRLRKEKDTLEHSDFWFKFPFLKTKHLIIIGSIFILLIVIIACFFTVKFIIKEIKPGAYQTISEKKVPVSVKKEVIPAKKKQSQPAKKSRKENP